MPAPMVLMANVHEPVGVILSKRRGFSEDHFMMIVPQRRAPSFGMQLTLLILLALLSRGALGVLLTAQLRFRPREIPKDEPVA